MRIRVPSFQSARASAFGLILFLAASVNAFAAQTGVTNAPALSPSLPDTSTSVIRVFGALILVVSIFLGGVWLFRNWQRLAVKNGRAARLNVLEVKSLGQRQAIYVIGYQQQRMLLASSPTGITLLSHLPAAEETDTPAAPAGKMSFADAFQQVLNRKQ